MRNPNDIEIQKLKMSFSTLKELREAYAEAEANYLRLVGAVALECEVPRNVQLHEDGWCWMRVCGQGPDGRALVEPLIAKATPVKAGKPAKR